MKAHALRRAANTVTKASHSTPLGTQQSHAARTNDFGDIKENLKQLEGRQSEFISHQEREHAIVQELSTKIQTLENAFETLSNAFETLSNAFVSEIDDLQGKIMKKIGHLGDKVKVVELTSKSVGKSLDIFKKKQAEQEGSVENSNTAVQKRFECLSDSVVEANKEVMHLKEQMKLFVKQGNDLSVEVEVIQVLQKEATEWTRTAKVDAAQYHSNHENLKKELKGTSLALASDVRTLADQSSAMRVALQQTHTEWKRQLESMREAMDTRDRNECCDRHERLQAVTEMLKAKAHESNAEYKYSQLQKCSSVIRAAMQEHMSICAKEFRSVSNRYKKLKAQVQITFQEVSREIVCCTTKCTEQHHTLQRSVHQLTQKLNIPCA